MKPKRKLVKPKTVKALAFYDNGGGMIGLLWDSDMVKRNKDNKRIWTPVLITPVKAKGGK